MKALKKTPNDVVYLIGSYALMLLVIFILPFFSLANYSILSNTTSHLGAQNTPNSWVMNVTFVLLGLTSVWAGWMIYVFTKYELTAWGSFDWTNKS